LIQRAGQCRNYMILADHIGKVPRPPLARECLVTHK
jgi:hypothetical protein